MPPPPPPPHPSLVFKLGNAHRFPSDVGVSCDEISGELDGCRWTFPGAVGGPIGCRSLTGKIMPGPVYTVILQGR